MQPQILFQRKKATSMGHRLIIVRFFAYSAASSATSKTALEKNVMDLS